MLVLKVGTRHRK